MTTSRLHRHLIAWLGIAAALVGVPAGAGEADESPTVAVVAGRALDLHKAPVVSLLEAGLSRKDGIRLLERMDVEKILEEQRLELALSPEGGRERVALGRLLKADVLVLLSARKEGARHIEIVVCETARGLRLLVRKARWVDDPKAGAAAIEGLLDAALGKYRESVAEIVAVPPFLSRDLGHEHDYLQGALARLIEQALLRRRGVLVVELAEARAISRELALAGDTFEVRRRLPLYFVGEYRSAGTGDARRISAALGLRRGKEEIASTDRIGMLPGEVGPFLLSATADLLARVAKGTGRPPAPRTEARQLTERADEFARLGFWKEAADLFEASILLDQDALESRNRLLAVLRKLAEDHFDPYADPDGFAKKGRLILDCYRQGLPHARFLLDSVTKGDDRTVDGMGRFLGCCSMVRYHRNCGAELAAISRKLEMERREILLGFLESRSGPGRLTYAMANAIEMQESLRFRQKEETLEENLRARLRAIRAIRDLPNCHQLIRRWARNNIDLGPRRSLEYREFIDQVAAIDRSSGQILLRYYQGDAATQTPRTSRPARPDKPAGKPTPEAVARRLRLSWEDARGKHLSSGPKLQGWLPCGKGLDVAWGPRAIFLMKKRGTLRRVYQSSERYFNFSGVCYDGRYIWVPVRRRREPLVLTIDPESGRVHRFTSEDGLPGTSFGVTAAPLGPGQVCVAGSFGKENVTANCDRSWCAVLELDGAGGKSVRIIHEARIQPKGGSPEEYKNAGVAFRPGLMVALRSRDGADRRVLLTRSAYVMSAGHHPLLLNPDGPPATVVEDSVAFYRHCGIAHDGAMYWTNTLPNQPEINLLRFGFPELRVTVAAKGLPGRGQVVFQGRRVHIFGKHWWTAEGPGGPFRKVDADIPKESPIRLIWTSSHYGLLIVEVGRDVFEIDTKRTRKGGRE